VWHRHTLHATKKTDNSQDTGGKLISKVGNFSRKNYFSFMKIAGTSEMLI
jgi:hypothetical protein